jgi:superfamily I DNA and RNA helicase
MSYDLQIWSAKKLNFQDEYFQKDSFKQMKDALVYESKDWQIVISESCEVDEEDIVPEIFSLLPGMKYLTEINLEPISAPKNAIKTLKTIAKHIAKLTYGVIVDEQADVILTPSGIKRVENFTVKENKNVVSMSWWFINDSRLRKDGLRELIDLIDLMLPEAMRS